jgi:hypothetical protein
MGEETSFASRGMAVATSSGVFRRALQEEWRGSGGRWGWGGAGLELEGRRRGERGWRGSGGARGLWGGWEVRRGLSGGVDGRGEREKGEGGGAEEGKTGSKPPTPTRAPGLVEAFRADLQEFNSVPGMMNKGKMLLRKYGWTSIGLYLALYLLPPFGFFAFYSAFHNFGLDPVQVFHSVGMDSLREKVWSMAGLDPNAPTSPQFTSVALAIVTNEIAEIVRIPLFILLLPATHRLLHPRR